MSQTPVPRFLISVCKNQTKACLKAEKIVLLPHVYGNVRTHIVYFELSQGSCSIVENLENLQ